MRWEWVGEMVNASPMNEISRPALLVLLPLFVILLIPFGQQAYLYEHWMNIGVFGAGFLLFGALLFRDEKTNLWHEGKVRDLFLLVIYLIHQFEEHGVDATGAHYAFMGSANAKLASLVGCPTPVNCPLNPENIFYVNTILVWFFLMMTVLLGARFAFASLCAASIILVNSVAHIFPGLLGGEYNPGLLTAIILFLPFSLSHFRFVSRTRAVEKRYVVASVLWAVLAHGILLVSAVLVYVKELFPHPFYPLILLLWSLVPFLVFTKVR